VSLADGAKHGYAITEDIASFAGVRFGPGSLYGAIARLESRGLIQALDAEDRRGRLAKRMMIGVAARRAAGQRDCDCSLRTTRGIGWIA
jgi:DNA-binding PadR family transcriptional regulator